MSVQENVQVNYRGIVIGKGVQLADFSPRCASLHLAQPMPVGSALRLTTQDGVDVAVQVIRVFETSTGDHSVSVIVRGTEWDQKASAWWLKRVTRQADPVIPEPATAGRRAATAEEAVVSEAESALASITADSAARAATRVAFSPVAQDVAVVPDGVPVAMMDASPTIPMGSGEIQQVIAEHEAAASSAAPEPSGAGDEPRAKGKAWKKRN